MFRNYLKSAVRNLLKNKMFTIVNVFGLAIGIASTLLISQYVRFERSYEEMHVNANNIFRITLDLYHGSEFIENDCETYQLLGSEFTEKMSEVKGYVRFMNWDATEITANEKSNYEKRIYMADPSAFDIFSYQMLEGDPKTVFDQPYKVVLTERLAMKYFGTLDVIGKTMKSENSNDPLEIVGVMKDLPQNTHLKFDMLISHATVQKYYKWYAKYPWGGNNEYTYLLMEEGTSVEKFNKKLKDYSQGNEALEDEIVISERIQDIHLYSNKTFEPEANGSAQSVNLMVMIAIFIMIIAWVNYVNLSTARATERAKEVGIRKAVGSTKNQLVIQFVFEAFLLNIMAALVAYTMVQIATPFFKSLTGQQLFFNLFMDQELWMMMIAIILLGTLMAGVYPAFVLSSFKPAYVLKGKFRNSSFGLVLRKGLIIFQFAVTVVLISVSIAMYKQIHFLMDKDLDIDIDNTVVLRSPSTELSDSLFHIGYSVFKDKLEASTDIEIVAQAEALPGANNHEVSTTDKVLRDGSDQNTGSYNYYIIQADEDYFQALGLALIAGENHRSTSNKGRVVINERAVETLGFEDAEDAIGQRINYGGDDTEEIIGVVSNYHQRSPKEDYVPMIFYYRQSVAYFVVKLTTKNTKRSLTTISEIWEEVFDGSGMDYYFLDEQYNRQYQADQRFSEVTLVFTIVSIIIACMGLFGLSSFMLIQRTKEIGIRKVLGASIPSIVQNLSTDFIKLVALSGVIAIPIAYFLIQLLLESYAYKLPIGWELLILPFALILIISLATIIGQILKSALANPVDSLKYE